MRTKAILLILLFLGLLSQGFSQSSSSTMRITGVHYQGRNLLRWVPADFANWRIGLSNGYRLQRFTLSQDGQTLSPTARNASLRTLATRIRPAAEAVLEAMADTLDAAAVAAAAIYSDTFTVVALGQDELTRASNETAENDNRYGFGLFAADASYAVALASGLAFVDTTALAPNTVYVYTLYFYDPANPTTLGTALGTGSINTAQALVLPPVPAPKVTVRGQDALLSWSKQGLDAYYIGYRVERSGDNGNTWESRNNTPLLATESDAPNADKQTLYFTDTLNAANVNYLYRIRGQSPYGFNWPVSESSNASSAPAELGVVPDIRSLNRTANNNLQLNWTFAPEALSKIQGFKVYRAKLVDGPYEAITGLLGTSTTTYTDESPQSSNYYTVKALDLNGKEWESIPVLGQPADVTPPAAPNNLQGQIDATGNVSLNWTANTESDLLGYRVYSSNLPDAEFLQLTEQPIERNTFTYNIDLKTLSENIYFKIMAIDQRQNNSGFSNVLVLKRPDIVPPAQPLLSGVEPMNKGATVKWTPSSSDDVVKHILQRRPKGNTKWTDVHTWNDTLSQAQTWLDSTHTDEAEWEYRVLAYDEAGLISSSGIGKVRIPNPRRAVVAGLKAELSTSSNQLAVKLTWEYPEDARVHDFLIYRSIGTESFVIYRTVVLSDNPPLMTTPSGKKLYVWKDVEVDQGQNYRYQIVARYLDGVSSPQSSVVQQGL